MTNINLYKQTKLNNIEKDIEKLEKIHSEYLQEELKERNGKEPNIEHINELTAQLMDMEGGNSSDPYSIDSFL